MFGETTVSQAGLLHYLRTLSLATGTAGCAAGQCLDRQGDRGSAAAIEAEKMLGANAFPTVEPAVCAEHVGEVRPLSATSSTPLRTNLPR